MIMSIRYTTPRQLEQTLTSRLRRAGYEDATAAKGTRHIAEGGQACLKGSFCKYGSVLMDPETLQGYERVLRELPGVIRTQIVHDDRTNHREGTAGHANPLRDQVIVIHRRMWEEPGS
jgi:hypothetical protein